MNVFDESDWLKEAAKDRMKNDHDVEYRENEFVFAVTHKQPHQFADVTKVNQGDANHSSPSRPTWLPSLNGFKHGKFSSSNWLTFKLKYNIALTEYYVYRLDLTQR